ncbi:hypothetical protein HMPREF9318_00390 [Streptococcus urinalis FB127-CNA-2]|uniref:YolD-like protein n=1 Tax=Streptococcus urinalis 2285-97 TaxID=764291 RepID=G5KFY2_9STRE|nr:hypothetical protein [Streptococcus urinalis]EHJ56093.1 hypothetical protein STRUR_1141 [Streptococcus urinalis 2285-97]EKS22192.1 hypothetical protein HMPREF9318_00390 [Streptococcus urinalis FB127-CNA-2]VEF32004.1 Uncharacterised protein [Streptococcus urinalis]
MIDRYYLPFESARYFQDRGMAKWMGFFLSEHTSAMDDHLTSISFQTSLTDQERYLYISQLYANQLMVIFHLKDDQSNTVNKVIGRVKRLGIDDFSLQKNDKSYQNIAYRDILNIDIEE